MEGLSLISLVTLEVPRRVPDTSFPIRGSSPQPCVTCPLGPPHTHSLVEEQHGNVCQAHIFYFTCLPLSDKELFFLFQPFPAFFFEAWCSLGQSPQVRPEAKFTPNLQNLGEELWNSFPHLQVV